MRVPNRIFGIHDWAYLKSGIREFKVKRQRDAELLLRTGHGNWDLGNNHFNELRAGMSVDVNFWRNWSSQSTKSTRRTGSLAFRRRSGCSATLFNYCATMKSISEAKLPINQKSSISHRVARYLWLLRQLKCLTALRSLQQVSELCLYMPSLYAYIYMPSNSTVTTSKGDTTEHTENEGLGVNICCSSASAPCQIGNNDGKSWNSPVVPPLERNLAGETGHSRTLWLRGAARKQRETSRRGRWNIRVRFPVWW